MISRSTLGRSHWWEFVYTERHHDVIMMLHHGNGPAFSRRCIFSFLSLCAANLNKLFVCQLFQLVYSNWFQSVSRGMIGPTIPDLEIFMNATTAQMSYILAGRQLGFILGNALGIIYETQKSNVHRNSFNWEQGEPIFR